MNSLLEALEEGRLVELPDDRSKERALTIVANLIEAIPSVPPGTDVLGAVISREAMGSTALGRGWACPHARLAGEGDLACSVGWSPTGIEYGSPDGRPVHILAMYLVPQNQKNAYLREISAIAKAVQHQPDDAWTKLGDLAHARHSLLDMIAASADSAGPDARARMIKLEARQAAQLSGVSLHGLAIEALTIIGGSPGRHIVLTQNAKLMEQLEAVPDLISTIGRHGGMDVGPWRILCRGATLYPADRVAYDCIAVKNNSAHQPAQAGGPQSG